MILKTCTYRLICLALALALALSLGACGKKGGFMGVADLLVSVEQMPSPEKDPAGFLRLNMKNTCDALKKRYAESPLAALAGVRADSGAFSLTLADTEERGALTAGLTFDRKAGRISLNAVTGQGVVRLYADPEFFGVSLPEVLGQEYYGFKPADIYEQASGSALGALMEEDTMASLKELEGLLDGVRSAPRISQEEAEKRLDKAFDELLAASDVAVERATVQYGEQKTDGCMITVDTDGAAVAACWEKIGDIFPGLKAALAGSGADTDSLDSPAVKCRGSFAANGCLISVSFTFTGPDTSQTALEANFFAENGETFTFTQKEEAVTLKSRPLTGESGWSHTLTLEKAGESAVLTTTYEQGKVSLSLVSPKKSGGVSGDLHITDSGFSFDNTSVTSDGQTRSDPLTVSFTAGGSVEKPTDTVNIFSLDEAELTALLIKAYTALGHEEIG